MRNAFIFIFSMLILNAQAQQQSYCTYYKKTFQKVLKDDNPNMVHYQYKRMLHACKIDPKEQEQLEKYFTSRGYEIFWYNDKSFDLLPPINGKYPLILEYTDHSSLLKDDKGNIVIEADYIRNLSTQTLPYYLVEDKQGKKSVYDMYGKAILTQDEYTSIMIFEPPHAILIKNGKYGVYDIYNQKLIIPFQNDGIIDLFAGFFAYQKNDNWYIIDDNNNITATLKARRIRVLYQGKFLVIDDSNKMGVYDVMGNIIIPVQYDNIDFDMMDKMFVLTKNNEKVFAQMNGQKME